ncbi:MAG: MBL fold metallo-hydrolase [Lentisphaeria bacterium]|nr:MBL fold metallo-hydrolase [Lentisphaeria bacterium]
MQFQQIRSATAIVTFGGSRFLIDPWLAPKDACPPIPGAADPKLRCPVYELPLPIPEILKVDAVIATHLHFDHFDETAIKVIPKTLTIFAQDEMDAVSLRQNGLHPRTTGRDRSPL